MELALAIKGLSFGYNDNGLVLDDLSLNIKKSTYAVILGHNGSGKSTLAQLIIGLLDHNQGEIRVFGEKLEESTVHSIRNKVGIVFQNPDNQFIGTTVRDDIAFGLENHQVPREKMDEIINEYAAKVGMLDFLDKEPTNLSGGQKQRVAIAGILAMEPDMIIFDEATSMLDPRGKKDIKDVILKMRESKKDITILSITHDIEEALLADEVIILDHGKIAKQGTPEEVFKDIKEITSYGLSIPFNFELAFKLKDKGIELESTDIEKMVESL